ncbi:MAG: hypothetical protein ACM3VT_21655 [Solirubrobacterales bacterium]
MNNRNYIERCINSLRLSTGADVHGRILDDVLRVHSEAKTARSGFPHAAAGRLIMTNWMLKIGGLGMAAVVAVVFFTHLGGGSAALADVLAHIQQDSYNFTLTIRSGQADSVLRGLVHPNGLVRLDAETSSTIVDLESRKSLLLSHQTRTAYYVEGREEPANTGSDRLLLLCSQPMESLWHLCDGTEEDLGDATVGGTKAHGFRIVREDEYFRNEITLWAAARSGRPLRVEIASMGLKGAKDRLDFVLENFVTENDLDDGQFSLEVPPGYVLPGQKTAPQDGSSDESLKIAEAFQLWAQGGNNEALDLLLTVDWDRPIAFAGEPYVFSLTEQAVGALEQTDRERVVTMVTGQCNQLRKICFALVERAKEAGSARDYARAETCLTAVVHLGELATRDPGGVFLARLTGIGAHMLGLQQLKSLYEQMNATEKLVDVELKIQQVGAEHQALARKAREQKDESKSNP